MDIPNGELVHGEFTSADASTAAAVALYDAQGVARVLAATERLIVESYHMVSAVALTVTLFNDNDADSVVDAGEVIGRGSFGANGGLAESSIQHKCKRGIGLKIKASGAGQVDAVVRGVIVSS